VNRTVTTPAPLRAALLVVGVAFVVRILAAFPGFLHPDERFRAPDTPGYWSPALALVATGHFQEAPDDPRPLVGRPPGFPAVLAGGIAAWLHAFNITAVAQAPLLLSDTLFALVVAGQLWCAVRYLNRGRTADAVGLAAVCGLGCLVRPLGLAGVPAHPDRYPDENSRVGYPLRRAREIVLGHPGATLRLSGSPFVFLPGAPTLLQTWGSTTGGRHILGVPHEKGLIAAVRNYFGDKVGILAYLLPALILVGSPTRRLSSSSESGSSSAAAAGAARGLPLPPERAA